MRHPERCQRRINLRPRHTTSAGSGRSHRPGRRGAPTRSARTRSRHAAWNEWAVVLAQKAEGRGLEPRQQVAKRMIVRHVGHCRGPMNELEVGSGVRVNTDDEAVIEDFRWSARTSSLVEGYFACRPSQTARATSSILLTCAATHSSLRAELPGPRATSRGVLGAP